MKSPSECEPTKTCSKCAKALPLAAFARMKRGKYGVDSRCRACKAAYRAANAERDRAAIRRWHQEHKEERRAYWSNWYRANRDGVIERATAHYRATYRDNKDRYIGHWHTRRARIAGAEVSDFTAADWLKGLDYFGGRCAYCGRDDLPLTRDHVVPLVAGGNHTAENIVPACGHCNSSKGDKGVLVWLLYDPPTGRYREVPR